MRPELDGKVALVTGGGRNVGSVIAKRLAADGAIVVINHFRSPEAARETRLAIEAAGGRAHVIRASVAIEGQRERMFDEIRREFGGLDILVNNAANGALVPSEEVTAALVDKALDTNYKGSFGCAQLAAGLMAERGGGSIINISTLGGGQFVMANYLACGPAKAALEALTRYLAVDYAKHNIRVNTAAAGMLESEVADLFPEAAAMQKAIVDATPMGRLGRPEELAEVVAFLASGRSSWITGQVLLADGGLSTGAALLSPPAVHQPAAPVTSAPATPAPVTQAFVTPVPVTPARETPTPAALPAAPALQVRARPVDPVDDDIAIVGMGIAVPGANDLGEYWDELMNGADRFIDIPADRWDNDMFWSADKHDEDKTYSKRSAFITDFRPHPALAAELSRDGGDPSQVELTTLWLRHALLQALDGVKRRPDDRFSFLVGYTADGSQHLEEATVLAGTLARLGPVLDDMKVAPAERASILGRISRSLKQRYPRSGPDPLRFFPHQVGLQAMDEILPAGTELLLVDTACSSSLYAIDLGLKGLLEGRHDVAICGGSFANGPRGSILFAKLNGLSTSGEVRSLDTDSDGVLFSDGAATVVLKRLSRAREDGDRVLATIKSFGSSSDGKGKAIYAPSAAGQKLAIRRALNTDGMGEVRPEWIVAHATGTPAGDLAEFTTLRETLGVDESVYVTSNKSVIGHTGWAAGAASLIEVVLGFENQVIPPQHRFTVPPADFLIDTTRLTIPTEPVDWPKRADDRRTASVSGFGFGGTNAHLIVQEPPPADAPIRAGGPSFPADERIVIVAHAEHFSGSDEPDGPDRLFTGSEPSFGDTYPLPSFKQVRMPPGVMRSIDRCQLMILQCAHTLRNRLGSFWEEHQALTGVVLGHLGATRNATLYATRCYLDDLTVALRNDPELAGEPWLPETLERLKAEIQRLVPPSNEDSFPGMMPNVIPARVANYFDLNGLNMTVDTGFTSTLSAIDVASRYLRQGELSMALVGGINGNSTAEVKDLLGAALDDDTVLAEGAFLFALVTERTARAAGLPVIGYLGTPTIVAERAPLDGSTSSIECGARRTGRDTCFLGAEGAVGVLQALKAGTESLVVCRGEDGAPDLTMRVSGPDGPAADPPSRAAVTRDRPQSQVPVQFHDERQFEGTNPLQVSRHVAALRPAPAVVAAGRPVTAFWPAEPTVVLTDQPALLGGQPLPAGTLVLSTRPPARESASLRYLSEVGEESVRAALDAHDPGHRLTHVRVVTDLGGVDVTAGPEPDGAPALHELAFLVLQQRSRALTDARGASFLGLFLRSVADGAPRPLVGLFTGLFKVAHLEFPAALTCALITSESVTGVGIDQAEAESTLTRGLPIAYYQSGTRLAMTVVEEPGELVPAGAARLGPDSVVLAVGGGRGITAELLTEVAHHFRPAIFVLGSNRLDSHPAHLMAMSDEEFGSARKTFITEQRALHPGRTPARINRDFERVRDARVTRANLERMAAHSGAGRVRYIACDITDRAQVAAAVEEVLAAAGPVDLLINVAGLNRSAPIASKSPAEFRLIRDLKLRGYYNLKAAFRGRPPRAWCNFGSLLGLTGQIGEVDYASANDFLATAAMFGHQELGDNEFTVGWTLWGEVGLGANSLTKAYFEKSGLYSNMTTAEGVHHFIRELNLARSSPSVVHLGSAEQSAVDRLLPGFLRPAESGPAGTGPAESGPAEPELPFRAPGPVNADFYLGPVVSRSTTSVEFARTFDLATDGYLRHHQVGAVATLPGTFVTEIALEAATALVPDLQVYSLEDLTFRHFLKVREKAPVHTRISARLVERRADLGQAQVDVRVTSDVVAPNGTVLIKDKVHFEVRVLLAEQLPAPPRWEPWYPADETPVPDPYHHPASPVLLTGMFVSTTDTRLHPLGKRATYNLALPVDEPTFSRFALPTILLDGLARTGVLTVVDGDLIPLAAPLSIGRIDFYEYASDAEVAARYGTVDLCVMVPTPGGRGGSPGPGNRFVAVRPDGRMLLQMKDLDWTLMGYLDRSTSTFLTPDQAEKRPARAVPTPPQPTPPQPTPPAPQPAPPNSQEVVRVGKAEARVSTRASRAVSTSGAPAVVGPGRTAPGPRNSAIPSSLKSFQRNAPRFFTDLQREYGDMVKLPLGFFTVHLNYDPDAIQYVLQDNNKNYVRGKGYDAFKIFMGIGLLTTDGDEWRQRRQIVNPLFHRTAINTMATTMTDATTQVLDDWERQPAAVREQGLDVVPEMMDLALAALGQIMFDTDLAPDRPQVGPAMVTAIEAMVFRGTLPQLTPSLIPIPYNLRIRRARKVLYTVVNRIVAAHREGRHDELTDLVSLLISAKDADTGEGLSDSAIRDEIMTVFMAGHETTGTGLAWALSELANNPDTQRELQAEADRVLGGRAPTMADLADLPYARMVADETLRLHPPIWVYPRDAVEEDVVGGYRIPAKGSVFLVPYVTHRHPDLWVDPDRFDPQRFSAEQEVKRPKYAYFPFGGGQRKCIGNSMALLQMQLSIVMVAQRFTLGVPPDSTPDLGTLVSLRPPSGIRLTIESRH